jgi:hypothetical protein
MKIQIEVEVNNAAFQDNPVAQILDKIPHNMKPGDDGKLRDSNGNTVGHWEANESF